MKSLVTDKTVTGETSAKGERVLDSIENALTLAALLLLAVRIGYRAGRDELESELSGAIVPVE